ncbi:extracellular solute-binding protein [Streptomyces sp. NPDC093109]|uniref:ABC transporter substrate-binding protein n=1 Tax=Streptomyces sp. NPDC093109 TaxID=3154977 RepID=UPI00344EFD42
MPAISRTPRSRPALTATAAVAALALAATACAGARAGGGAADTPGAEAKARTGGDTGSGGKAPAVREETRSLDELYRAAKAEGGRLTIYAGGDTPTQQNATKAAFTKRFPDIKLNMVVDYSKYHDARIDNQLATDTLVPDVTQLQTLQDFTRWKAEGKLLPYKPAGFARVHEKFKDKDGAWTAIGAYSFSLVHNNAQVGAAAPGSARELTDPKWKGRIASTYPNDDDAALFLYKKYVDTYGWKWLAALAKQDLRFRRGSNTPADAVDAGTSAVGLATGGSPVRTPGAKATWIVPKNGEPFMAWGQRAAILKGAKHPHAARLYLNWAVSREVQSAGGGWNVRTDVAPTGGLKPIWEYPNAHLDGFVSFMEDRAGAERLRQTMTLYFGEVRGRPSPGRLGLHPGR